MWPEEATLEDDISELSGGNAGERWVMDERGDGTLTTPLAMAAAPFGDNEGTVHQMGEHADDEGLDPKGGLRDEWDMMTSEEKVCYGGDV